MSITLAIGLFVLALALGALFSWALVRGGAREVSAATPAPRDPQARCRTCVFFDLEEGQAFMRQHRAFAEAAVHLAPAEMGRQVDPVTQEPIERDIPHKAAWQDFGVCMRHLEGVWGEMDKRRRLRVISQPDHPWDPRMGDCYSTHPEDLDELDRPEPRDEGLPPNPFGKAPGSYGAAVTSAVVAAELDVAGAPVPAPHENLPPLSVPEPVDASMLGDDDGGTYDRDPETGDLVYRAPAGAQKE